MTPLRGTDASTWVLRPTIGLVLSFGMAIAIWFLWIALQARFPTPLELDRGFSLIDDDLFWKATGATMGLALISCLDLARTKSSPFDVRRAHRVGIVLGLVLLGFIQFGLGALAREWRKLEAADPATLPAFLDAQGEKRRAELEQVLDLFEQRYPGFQAIPLAPNRNPRPQIQLRDGGAVLLGTLQSGRSFLWLDLYELEDEWTWTEGEKQANGRSWYVGSSEAPVGWNGFARLPTDDSPEYFRQALEHLTTQLDL